MSKEEQKKALCSMLSGGTAGSMHPARLRFMREAIPKMQAQIKQFTEYVEKGVKPCAEDLKKIEMYNAIVEPMKFMTMYAMRPQEPPEIVYKSLVTPEETSKFMWHVVDRLLTTVYKPPPVSLEEQFRRLQVERQKKEAAGIPLPKPFYDEEYWRKLKEQI